MAGLSSLDWRRDVESKAAHLVLSEFLEASLCTSLQSLGALVSLHCVLACTSRPLCARLWLAGLVALAKLYSLCVTTCTGAESLQGYNYWDSPAPHTDKVPLILLSIVVQQLVVQQLVGQRKEQSREWGALVGAATRKIEA